MAKYTLDIAERATLAPETRARLAAFSDEAVEALAGDADSPATTDEELDRAVAARRFRLIRSSHGLSQAEFARILHVPAESLRDWEDGRRLPDPAALALLTVFDNEPEAFARAFEKQVAGAV